MKYIPVYIEHGAVMSTELPFCCYFSKFLLFLYLFFQDQTHFRKLILLVLNGKESSVEILKLCRSLCAKITAHAAVYSQKRLIFAEVNECATNLCLNGGNCTDLFLDYNCSCAPGYSGKNCSVGEMTVFRAWALLILDNQTSLDTFCDKRNFFAIFY